MRGTLHTFETYKRILDMEERRGKLKKDTFSDEVRRLSSELKEARQMFKHAAKKEKEKLGEKLADTKAKYEEKRSEEIQGVFNRIMKEKCSIIQLREVNAKGKTGFATDNVESLLLSKVLMLELKRSYKFVPANRNNIIEELRALLDNPMPKIVIRADIHHFFESIPQDILIEKILKDSYLSSFSLKCLKTFFYKYNELSGNLETKIGIPRGLSFSSYLAEIYLSTFDRKIRQIKGIYFYKRYVDDIIIIANPTKSAGQDYWNRLESEVALIGLEFNDDAEKRSCSLYTPMTSEPLLLNYLGYQFRYLEGKLDVLLTDRKYNRYKDSIRLIFEKYKEIGNHTSRRKNPKEKRIDATLQFMHRLNALTGNGHLNGRKNYVLVGTYYSNKYLTSLEQLVMLDEYLKSCLNDSSLFCPSTAMFNYSSDNDYQKNTADLRIKILKDYSFVKGFNDRRMYRWSDYALILRQLGNLYYSQENDG